MISAVGETDCQLCPTKFFCPNPMISLPCPDNALAVHGATECQFRKNKSRNKRFVEKDDCNDGQYVNENNACADCPNGMIGDGKVCTKCASGQIVERKSSILNLRWSKSLEIIFWTFFSNKCKSCPSDQVPNADLDSCQNCNPGQYPAFDQSSCYTCPAGYQCSKGSKILCDLGYTVINDACTICPAGSYCPSPFASPIPCPGGTYSKNGYSVCLACPAGFRCTTQTDFDENDICDPGSYSGLGDTDCTDCPSGHFCPDIREKLEIPCPPGSYSTGKALNCTECDEGSSCTEIGTLTACPDWGQKS